MHTSLSNPLYPQRSQKKVGTGLAVPTVRSANISASSSFNPELPSLTAVGVSDDHYRTEDINQASAKRRHFEIWVGSSEHCLGFIRCLNMPDTAVVRASRCRCHQYHHHHMRWHAPHGVGWASPQQVEVFVSVKVSTVAPCQNTLHKGAANRYRNFQLIGRPDQPRVNCVQLHQTSSHGSRNSC